MMLTSILHQKITFNIRHTPTHEHAVSLLSNYPISFTRPPLSLILKLCRHFAGSPVNNGIGVSAHMLGTFRSFLHRSELAYCSIWNAYNGRFCKLLLFNNLINNGYSWLDRRWCMWSLSKWIQSLRLRYF